MEVKYSKIKEVIKNTPEELKGKAIGSFKSRQIGYFTPNNANWSYMLYIIDYKGFLYEVATTFGWIE